MKKKTNETDGRFIIEFEKSKVERVQLSQDFFQQSFYCNERMIYSKAKSEPFILMDIALVKGSRGAIPEGFYASIGCQQ